jgi:hypothetical protein
VTEEQRADNGNLSQAGEWPGRQARPGQAHERVAKEVGKVTADKRQDESHSHLGLFQGDRGKRDDQGDSGPDQRPGQKAEEQAFGPD